VTRATFLLCAGLLCGAALLGCPSQPPPPTPPPPPPPTTSTTTATTVPAECFAPLPGPAGDYVGVATLPPEHLSAILEARDWIGRYTCWKDSPDTPLFRMAAELRDMDLCAVKSEDRVIIQRSDGDYEEWHLVRYDTGCWASAERAYKGTLRWIGAAQ